MAQQIIDNGTFDNDPSAEKIRLAFNKTNDNFTELYGYISGTGKAMERVVAHVESGESELVEVANSVNASAPISKPRDTILIISFLDPYSQNSEGINYVKKRQYILKRGEGNYGNTGTAVLPTDFIILTPNIIGINDTTTFNLGNIMGVDIDDYVNTSGPYLVIGTTIFETTEGSYVFSGADGLYGLGEIQTIPQNFIPFGNAPSIAPWEKIHNLSLSGITTDGVDELTYIANAVIAYGPFTCDPDQQIIFRTTTPYGDGVIDRYYSVIPRVTSIGGILGGVVYPSYFRPDGQSIVDTIPSDIIIELGNIATGPVEDYFNEGDGGAPWDMSVKRFIRGTLDGVVTLWSWQGEDGDFGGSGTPATADDFFLITGEPTLPTGLFKQYATTTAMIADQSTQIAQQAIEVLDASDDPNIVFAVGETKLQAYYRKIGASTTGSIDDYRLISAPYSTNGGGELEKITEAGKTGYRIKGRDPEKYGDIGNQAVDISIEGASPSSIRGATGDFSFASCLGASQGDYSVAGGLSTFASGTASLAMNNATEAVGNNAAAFNQGSRAHGTASFSCGADTFTDGNYAFVGGHGTYSRSYGESSFGVFGTDYVAGSKTAPIGTDRLFGVFNGTSDGARSNALIILKNGLIIADSLSIAIIDGEPTGKVLITKEWAKANGLISTERIIFDPIIKADKKYFTTDTNRYTQIADINFTFDNTDAVIDGGCIIEIVGSGNKAIFTTDFGAINTSLVLNNNYVTLQNGVIYKFVFYWTGVKVNAMIGEISDVIPPQLIAPIISDSEWFDTTTATITLTDTNTSPNEVETQVEWSIAGAGVWTLGDTVAQDETTATITGLDDTNSYDFRAKAIGDGVTSSDSEYSTIETLAANIPTVILMSDDFSAGSVDTGKWTVVSQTNGVTTQSSGTLKLSATGTQSNRFGLKSLVGYSSANDLIIVQVKLTIPNSANLTPFFGLSIFPLDETELACIARNTTTSNNYRLFVKDNNVNELVEDTSILSGKDVRIKYIPSTGAVSFEYWNGSAWTSLGSSGNVDLGTTVSVILLANSGATSSLDIIYDDFFISDDDYSTQYPV